MDFNFDNLFLLIGVAAFLISILVKKKKVRETVKSVISGDDQEYYDDYSDNEIEERTPETDLSDKIITADLSDYPHSGDYSHSGMTKESDIPDKSVEKISGYSDMHDVEKKDIDHFDLRNAVIMSTILERKYF